jgi:thymidylate synthase ThyX
MTITAKILCKSKTLYSNSVLRSLQLRYPRFIHAEFMTHRVFSRNASSSRAVPVEKLIADILEDLAIPVEWGKNRPGMQAKEQLDFDAMEKALTLWVASSRSAIRHASELHKLSAHKQIVNRVLEPYSHINVVVTATEWDNFFELRRHPDAQPEMRALADAIWEADQEAEAKLLHPGEWHLPYIDPDDAASLEWDPLIGTPPPWVIRRSVARCARVSYYTHEGRETSVDEDARLYHRLVGSRPVHASPAEHQATPDYPSDSNDSGWQYPHQWGNFRGGWRQFRQLLPF